MWIAPNKYGDVKIMHEHYIKDVATRGLIDNSSAHPRDMKHNVLVNEATRVLRNGSSELEWEQVTHHLDYFVKRMQYSGYSQETRYKVMKKVIDKHEKIKRENEGS